MDEDDLCLYMSLILMTDLDFPMVLQEPAAACRSAEVHVSGGATDVSSVEQLRPAEHHGFQPGDCCGTGSSISRKPRASTVELVEWRSVAILSMVNQHLSLNYIVNKIETVFKIIN